MPKFFASDAQLMLPKIQQKFVNYFKNFNNFAPDTLMNAVSTTLPIIFVHRLKNFRITPGKILRNVNFSKIHLNFSSLLKECNFGKINGIYKCMFFLQEKSPICSTVFIGKKLWQSCQKFFAQILKVLADCQKVSNLSKFVKIFPQKLRLDTWILVLTTLPDNVSSKFEKIFKFPKNNLFPTRSLEKTYIML